MRTLLEFPYKSIMTTNGTFYSYAVDLPFTSLK